MADIELIPRDYLALRRLRRWLQRFGVGLAVLLLLAGGTRAWLGWRLGSERPQVEALRQSALAAGERLTRLTALRARKLGADAHLAALQEMRDPAGWDRIVHAIDAAYQPPVWLEGLTYARDVEFASPASAAAAAPAAPAASAGRPVLSRRFDLQGHALAHAAVTDFMRALGGQPGIEGLRLGETRLRREAGGDVVDFQLGGRIDTTQRKTTP